MKIELKDGLEFEVREMALNDWRLAEMLSDLDDGNALMVVKVARFLLTDESYEKLKNVNTDKDGHMDAGAVEQMLADIIFASDVTKK